MENLGLGVLLMVVGMITVFVILWIIIGFGNLLIRLVNKYAPEEKLKVAMRPAVAGAGNTISDPIVAAIVSAVSITTQGKGKVTSIKK